jgi:hypothetical protein
MQLWPGRQATPQAPQSAELVQMSTQLPPQTSNPAVQLEMEAQIPPSQYSDPVQPGGQTMRPFSQVQASGPQSVLPPHNTRHAPQLAGSESGFTHLPSHIR